MTPGAEHLPPLNLARRFFGDDKPFERFADYIDYVLEVQGDVSALIAEPLRWTTVEAPPPEFWPQVKDSAPAPWRAADLRRDPELPCANRSAVRLRTFRDDARHPRHRQGPWRGDHAARGDPGPRPARLRAGRGARTLYAREESGRLRSRARDARGHRRGEADRSGERTRTPRPRAACAQFASAIRSSATCAGSAAISASRSAVTIRPDRPSGSCIAALSAGSASRSAAEMCVTLCPPLTIPFEQFDEALSIFEEALSGLKT